MWAHVSGVSHDSVCALQLEEVRSVPASSEQVITESSARKEELEEKKLQEEQKLAQVMESLKEETSGLQDEKEVTSHTSVYLRFPQDICSDCDVG